MNLRPFIALLAAMPLAFIGGCTPDETVEPPVITVENSSITPAGEGTEKISYSVENPVEGSGIKAESSVDWIDGFNYDTEGEISFAVALNISDERSGIVTLTYPGAEQVQVSVTQMAAGESIELQPGALSFAPAGGPLTVKVVSGKPWVMTGESDWVSASAASGDPGAQVTFTAQANESDEPREATFQFICGANVVPLTVTQSFAGRIIVEKAEYDIPGTANTFSIALQSNMSDVKVEITEGSDWLTDVTTKAMQDMSFEFSATENEGDETRTAVVVFSNADASEQVTVNQEPSFPSDVLTRVTDEEFKTYLRDNFDTDGDGIPDNWEDMYGLDPTNPDDARSTHKSGYPWLEYYLSTLVNSITTQCLSLEPSSITACEENGGHDDWQVTAESVAIKGASALRAYNMAGVPCDYVVGDYMWLGRLDKGMYVVVADMGDGRVLSKKICCGQ